MDKMTCKTSKLEAHSSRYKVSKATYFLSIRPTSHQSTHNGWSMITLY